LRSLPNALTASRLVLAVAFPWLPVPWRVAVLAWAAVSDLLDGWLARRLGVTSTTGRLLDPIADKAFILILAGTLVAEDALSVWWALGIAVRDLVVLAGVVAVLVQRKWKEARSMRPQWLGKAATAAQFVTLLVLVGRGSAPPWLLGLTVLLSAAAAVDYALAFVRSRAEPR
jgi:phosphatidylglycerophosphate synthase